MNNGFNKSGASINIITPRDRRSTQEEFYKKLSTAVQVKDIKRYVVRVLGEREYHRIWPTEDLTRHIQKAIWAIQRSEKKWKWEKNDVQVKVATYNKHAIRSLVPKEIDYHKVPPVPILILDSENTQCTSIHWENLRMNKKYRYSIFYDAESIAWYKANFIGGYQEWVISHEEIAIIKNIPLEHLWSYLQSLLS